MKVRRIIQIAPRIHQLFLVSGEDPVFVIPLAIGIGKEVVFFCPQGLIADSLEVNFFDRFFVQLLDDFGRTAHDEGMGRHDGTFGDQGTGSYDRAFTGDRLVQYAGSHADEAVVFDPAAVKKGTVADGHKVSDVAFIAFPVDHRIVLYIGVVPDGDGFVTPDRGMVLGKR